MPSPIIDVEVHRRDIEAALARAWVSLVQEGRLRATGSELNRSVMGPEELIVGRLYRRSDLHDCGLGGNRQRGISYPLTERIACCSAISPRRLACYRDGPVGDDGYRYFGAWDGPGDMSMTRGNEAVLERSPELFLFVKSRSTHQFVGQFECIGHRSERTIRDGAERKRHRL